jgi:hypothetical protein
MTNKLTEDVNLDSDSSGWVELDLSEDTVSMEDLTETLEDTSEIPPKEDLVEEETLEEEEEELEAEEVEEVEAEEEEASVEEEEEDTKEEEVEKNSRYSERVRQLANEKNEALARQQELEQQVREMSRLQQESDRNSAETHITALNAQIQSSKKIMQDALEQGDTGTFLEESEKAQKAQVQIMALENYKQSNVVEEEDYIDTPPQQQIPDREVLISQLPDKGQDWALENDWFLTNPRLTEVALEIAVDIEAEGFTPDEDDYYEEVMDRMAERFPRKFGKTEKPKVAKKKVRKKAPMSSASQPAKGQSKRNTVRLSASEQEMAHRLNISPREYAKQKKLQQDNDGRWTELFI